VASRRQGRYRSARPVTGRTHNGPGTGLGSRRRTGGVKRDVAALRRVPDHRPLGQGKRRTHLEERVRIPSTAVLPRPPRGLRRRSTRRAATARERRKQHRRRPHHRLDQAIAALPAHARPRPGHADSPKLLASADSAGATHAFAAALRARGIGYSLGFAVDENVQQAILTLPKTIWTPAYNADSEPRRGAWVAEITDLLNLPNWPTGSRVIIRKERPHPGAQLTFSDIDGHRFTAFLTDTPTGQLPDLEQRHRTHARVEDRIRDSKDTGIRNLPCYAFAANACWLELALAATDLLCWTQALCFTGAPARTEPATFRYQILHTAGLLVRTARGWHLRLDQDWPWAHQLATAFDQLRTAPWPAT
jgi:hypothetical protein